MKKRNYIFTGVIAWLGGLGTAMLAPSCDPVGEECEAQHSDHASVVVTIATSDGTPVQAQKVTYKVSGDDMSSGANAKGEQVGECIDEMCTKWALGTEVVGTFSLQAEVCSQVYTETVEVDLAANGCHVETERVDITVPSEQCLDMKGEKPGSPDARGDDGGMVGNPLACDMAAYPAVFVSVVQRYDDFYATVPVENVKWKWRDETYDARCLSAPGSDECYAWVAGYETPGEIEVSTEWCDVEVSDIVHVGLTEDECHVKTEYLMLEVSTRGCMAGTEPPPKPSTPWTPINPKFKPTEKPEGPTERPM